uniref:GIY-YIG domain-containing protein n=1 Tax=Tremella fuciformis TaxID=64657 RepID=A0A2H4QBR1_9TREE|nr:hypothetical protein [Tremella fuciformis]
MIYKRDCMIRFYPIVHDIYLRLRDSSRDVVDTLNNIIMAAAKYIITGYRSMSTLIKQTGSQASHLRDQRLAYWRNHNAIVKHVNRGLGISMDLMNKVLFTYPAITEQHMQMCWDITQNGVTTSLPYPHTDQSRFTAVGGKSNPYEQRSDSTKIPGCYLITDGTDSYIGQAVHLGKRVREHAAQYSNNTSTMVGSTPNDSVKVTLFVVPRQDSYYGLTLSEFLCVLELYLFLHFGLPTLNKSYVPTPGVMNTPEGITKHLEKTARALFIYRKLTNGSLQYLYYSQSQRGFMRDFGVGKSWVNNIYTRSDGWIRGTMLLSPIDLLPGDKPAMTLQELIEFRKELEAVVPKGRDHAISATHKETGKMLFFKTNRARTKALKGVLDQYDI